MVSTKRQIAGGASNAWLGFYNNDGWFAGGTPDAPAAGLSSGMIEMLGVKTAPANIPEPEAMIIDGDDEWLGEISLESIASRGFICEFAVGDLQTDAYLLGTTVESIAGGDWGALDVKDAPERDVCFIVQSRAKKFNAADKGRKAWNGLLIPMATATPLGRNGFTSRGAAVWRMKITPQLSSHNPWGVTFAAGNVGATTLGMRPFNSDYPYTMTAFTGNGTEDEITLDVEPANVAKASAWANQGTPLTVSSVSAAGVTPRILTLSAAPALNAHVVALTQYNRK